MKRCTYISVIFVLLLASATFAQTADQIVKLSATIRPKNLSPAGQKVTALLTAKIEDGWHVHALSQVPGGPTTMVVTVRADQFFRLAAPVTSTKGENKFDANFEMNMDFYEGLVEVRVPLLVGAQVPAGTQKVRFDVLFQTCNETTCLPPTRVHLEAIAEIAGVMVRSGQQR
jgi:thiol:disulfide interchange protein DsbD